MASDFGVTRRLTPTLLARLQATTLQLRKMCYYFDYTVGLTLVRASLVQFTPSAESEISHFVSTMAEYAPNMVLEALYCSKGKRDTQTKTCVIMHNTSLTFPLIAGNGVSLKSTMQIEPKIP